MNRGELRSTARLRLVDSTTPYGWSDAELNDFLSESIEEAAVRADLLVESSTLLAPVTLVLDQMEYELDCDFLRISRVVMDGYHALVRTSRHELDEYDYNWEARASGKPEYYIADDLPTKVGVWPKPDTDYAGLELKLRVVYLPRPLSTDTSVPEIPAIHHRNLVEWVLHRAYQKRDTDYFDQRASDRALAAFERYFGPRADAKTLTHEQRQEFYIQPKVTY